MTDLDGLRKFYAQTAPRYEDQVVPVFGPLAQSLANWIARCVAAQRTYSLLDPFDLDDSLSTPLAGALSAIDVGTGTALLARNLASILGSNSRIVGVDASPAMLSVAQRLAPAIIRVAQADGHDLALPANVLQPP